MQMPIPKPRVLGDIDLHYVTFAETHLFPFTGSLPRGWAVELVGEAARTKDVVDGTTTPSSANKGRKRKASATNSVVVPRTTSSKGAKNGRMRRTTD